MSNGNGISFVHDLVAMATAADKVPQLEARIAELEAVKADYESSLLEKEEQLIDRANAHGETEARLHNAEVARDDAEFRFLEADDAKLAAVRAMRMVIGEAEAFVKAVTPVEPEIVKPSYEGKWLYDVKGWQGISLSQWLELGGLGSRFVQPATEPTGPNVPSESISGSGEGEVSERSERTVTEVSASNPNPTASDSALTLAGLETELREPWPNPTANTLGSGQSPLPSVSSGDVESGEGAHMTSGESAVDPTVVGVGAEPQNALSGSAVSQGYAASGEGESAPNPTAETLIGSESSIVQSSIADDFGTANGEGDKADPFASATIIESQPASSHGAESEKSAPLPASDDDLWAIPSRASHFSG